MRIFRTVTLACAGLLWWAVGAAGASPIVVNGDFSLSVPGNGWSVANVDYAGGHRSSGGNPGGWFVLNDNGNAGTDPTIWQDLTGLSPGSTYQVSGEFLQVYYGGDTSTQAFGVAIDGLYRFESPQIWSSGFQGFAFSFVAPQDGSVRLSVAAERNETDHGFGVDNIDVTLVSQVPLPSALVLLGSGLVGLVLRRRR